MEEPVLETIEEPIEEPLETVVIDPEMTEEEMIADIMAKCICPDYPVTAEKGLMWSYYCTRGSAEEMMAAE